MQRWEQKLELYNYKKKDARIVHCHRKLSKNQGTAFPLGHPEEVNPEKH
jgi:hypothetical protein